MDAKRFVERCSGAGSTIVEPVDAPSPFVVPGLSAQLEDAAASIALIAAPAAVGKSTFARWLAHRTGAQLIDLRQLQVGSHGFVGSLATAGLQQPFDRGDLTVVIDSLDEGLVRSGFANYEAFLSDVGGQVNGASGAWPPGSIRVILLGRPDSVDMTELVLQDASSAYERLQLDYLDEAQATQLVLAYAGSEDQPYREGARAFFDAAARALQLDRDQLWNDPVGRGFAGYPPVLRIVSEALSPNPAIALSAWQHPREWESAWQLLTETAGRLLERERGTVVRGLGLPPDGPAYSREHQLKLLGARLAGAPTDCCAGLSFETPQAEQAFRDAVDSHLPEHPFLAEGASEVFGSMVAAYAIAHGESLRGAEVKLASYSNWPFMWRFFAEEVSGQSALTLDATAIGWILASLWTGVEDSGSTTVLEAGVDAVSLRVSGAVDRDVAVDLAGILTLRGLARSLDVDLPGSVVRLAPRGQGSSAGVFVFRDSVAIAADELIVDASEVLVEGDGFVLLDVRKCNSPVVNVSARPAATVVVSTELFRHPWSAVAKAAKRHQTDDEDWGSHPVQEMLRAAAGVLPGQGRPAFLDSAGRPDKSDQHFAGWSNVDRQALGALVMDLVRLGCVTRTSQSSSGPSPTFSFRPSGFGWEDLAKIDPSEEPWSEVDWRRVLRFFS